MCLGIFFLVMVIIQFYQYLQNICLILCLLYFHLHLQTLLRNILVIHESSDCLIRKLTFSPPASHQTSPASCQTFPASHQTSPASHQTSPALRHTSTAWRQSSPHHVILLITLAETIIAFSSASVRACWNFKKNDYQLNFLTFICRPHARAA